MFLLTPTLFSLLTTTLFVGAHRWKRTVRPIIRSAINQLSWREFLSKIVIRSLLFLLTYCSLMGASCSPPPTANITPLESSFHTIAPNISVEFLTQVPTDYVMVLNGVDVTRLFTGTGLVRSANSSAIRSYLWQGKNYFQVIELKGQTNQRSFFYDYMGPDVHLTYVNKDQGSVTIEGHLKDASIPKSARLNNTDLILDKNFGFKTTVPTSEYFHFDTTDELGFTNRVSFHNNKSGRTESMRLTIDGSTGLSAIDSIVEQAFVRADIGSWMRSYNPLINTSISGSSGITNLNVNTVINQLPVVDMSIKNERLEILHTFNTLTLDVSGTFTAASGGTSSPIKGTLVFNNVVVKNVTNLTVNSKSELIPVSDSVNVTFASMQTQWVSIPIDKVAMETTLKQEFPSKFATAARQPLTTLLQSKFKELNTQSTLTVNGREMTFTAIPKKVSLASGRLTFDIETESSSKTAPIGPTSLGYRYVNSMLPSATTIGPDAKKASAGAVFSINALNQALWIADEAGFNKVTINIPRKDNPQENLPLRLNLSTREAPYLGRPQAVGTLKALVLNDTQVTGEIMLETGEWVEVFSANVDIIANSNLDINLHNEITVQVVNVSVEIDVVASNSALTWITSTFVNSLIIRYMPQIIPEVTRSISVISVPVFLGFTIDIDKLWVNSKDNQHLNAVGNLIKTQ